MSRVGYPAVAFRHVSSHNRVRLPSVFGPSVCHLRESPGSSASGPGETV